MLRRCILLCFVAVSHGTQARCLSAASPSVGADTAEEGTSSWLRHNWLISAMLTFMCEFSNMCHQMWWIA